MRVLLLLPRISPGGDSTWIFFSRLAAALEGEGARLGVVHGAPPGWGEPPVPPGWWRSTFPAPRRRDLSPLLGPPVRLWSWLTPWKGGVLHVGATRKAVREAVSEWRPDLVLCHDFPALIDAAWRAAPDRTCLWMVEPNPLVPSGGASRRVRDRIHRPWWDARASAVRVLAATWSGKHAQRLEARLGRPVETLFPGVPNARVGEGESPRLAFFGTLRGRMMHWLADRIGPLAAAARERGLRLAFYGLRAGARRWVAERVPDAHVPERRLSHPEAMEEMASSRALLAFGASGIQATGKVLDYLATGRPTLYFGRAAAEDARLLREAEAGAAFNWRVRPDEMAACLDAALAHTPGPPPERLSAPAQARRLLGWFGSPGAGLP